MTFLIYFLLLKAHYVFHIVISFSVTNSFCCCGQQCHSKLPHVFLVFQPNCYWYNMDGGGQRVPTCSTAYRHLLSSHRTTGVRRYGGCSERPGLIDINWQQRHIHTHSLPSQRQRGEGTDRTDGRRKWRDGWENEWKNYCKDEYME